MLDTIDDLAHSLKHTGMSLVSVDQTLVDDALGAIRRIIAMLDPEIWALTRFGEDEADVGLVYREGKNGSDHKYFFHYAHDFERIAWERGLSLPAIPKKDLQCVQQLYELLNHKALSIAAALEAAFPHTYRGELVTRMRRSMAESHPYATTTLRGLWYPAHAAQKGAKIHLDRSLFTLHLGDEGGSLLAVRSQQDGGGQIVSPPKGRALVFCGVKILEFSRGRLQPLWHRSTVEAESDRKALVHFVHVPTAVPVKDATETWMAYRKRRL